MRIIGSKQLKLSTVCFDALKTSKPVWLLPSVSVFSLYRYFTHDVFLHESQQVRRGSAKKWHS